MPVNMGKRPPAPRVRGPQPIIFSAPMVRALLAGAKTQTRRIVSRSNSLVGRSPLRSANTWGRFERAQREGRWAQGPDGSIWIRATPRSGPPTEMVWDIEPRLRAGDVLFVREGLARETRETMPPTFGGVYVADGAPAFDTWGWKSNALSPIHMPFGARRLELVLTAVRGERLVDITDLDARGEGVRDRAAFEAAWHEIHGPKAWIPTAWVWVYTFTTRAAGIYATKEG